MPASRQGFPIRRKTSLLHFFRQHVKSVLGALAAVGLSLSIALDVGTGWFHRLPLTTNLVSGILQAPLSVLLALVVFDRLVAAERRRGWLNRNYQELRHDVPEAVRKALEALNSSWPLEQDASFQDDVTDLLHLLESVTKTLLPSETTLAQAQKAMISVSPHIPHLDTATSITAVRSLITTVEPLIAQLDVPSLAEYSADVKAAAAAYLSSLEVFGYQTEQFARSLHDLAEARWGWEPERKWIQGQKDNVTVGVHPAALAASGFLYLRQLTQAQLIDAACSTLIREIEKLL